MVGTWACLVATNSCDWIYLGLHVKQLPCNQETAAVQIQNIIAHACYCSSTFLGITPDISQATNAHGFPNPRVENVSSLDPVHGCCCSYFDVQHQRSAATAGEHRNTTKVGCMECLPTVIPIISCYLTLNQLY